MNSMRIEGPFALWRHEDLSLLGTVGAIEKPLEVVRGLVSEDLDFEIAPVRQEGPRDLLALVASPPYRDITFSRYGPQEGGLVICSLDEGASIRTAHALFSKGIFKPWPQPSPLMIRSLSDEFSLEILGYQGCKTINKLTTIPLERVFSSIRYANFLHRYKGVREAEALRRGREKYTVIF